MALGKQYKDDGSKVYVLRPTNKNEKKEKVPVHFDVFEKKDGKWVKTREETRVSGDLFKLEIKEFEFEKVVTKSVTIGLKDYANKETYLVDTRFNIPARSLYNMLISLTTNFDNLSLSIYNREHNGNEYDAFSLRQGQELVPWKYKIADLPKAIETTFKGQVMRDYTPIDEFFEKELIELSNRLAKRPAKSVAQESAPVTQSAPAKTEGDVPPF